MTKDAITKLPAKILKTTLKPLTKEELLDEKTQKLIDRMHAQMTEAQGVGLAANQVGENLAIFVIDKKLAEESKVPDAYINPEITEYSKDKDDMEEGCLSIPEFYVPIRRSKKIKIKALDRTGTKIKLKVKGFLARVLQHETDHLNGLTIKDRFNE